MTGLLYVFGTLLYITGILVGLSLSGILILPHDHLDGRVTGLIPVISGILGTLAWFEAHRTVVRHKNAEPPA